MRENLLSDEQRVARIPRKTKLITMFSILGVLGLGFGVNNALNNNDDSKNNWNIFLLVVLVGYLASRLTEFCPKPPCLRTSFFDLSQERDIENSGPDTSACTSFHLSPRSD